MDWIRGEYLRDLERAERYDNNNPFTQMFFWQAFARISVYKRIIDYDEQLSIEKEWERLSKIPLGLRWNTEICPTLRETIDGEIGCHACSSYEEDPEVDCCSEFGLCHGMDDPEEADFSSYICDEFRENK